MKTSGLVETCAKEEEEEGLEKKPAASGFQSHLGPKTKETELRLGFSLNGLDEMVPRDERVFSMAAAVANFNLCAGSQPVLKQRNNGFGGKRGFSETEDGFQNLSWRREKAVFEQQKSRAPPVVGWPPVCVFRKNLAPQTKLDTEVKGTPSIKVPNKVEESLFVKVNMEGYAVGRKIDLKAYDSYESLSCALQNMFNNFLSVNYHNNEKQGEEDELVAHEHVLIYEDNEGDRMLVGDVPWEMFITTVKRLYIISGARALTLVAGRVARSQE